jgi:PLP dependent protein
VTQDRREEIALNLDALRTRITQACAPVGRDPSAITVIAVTKTFPASDIEHLAALGIRDVGENRDQEAREKFELLHGQVRWHFIGQVQRNKARSIARYADVVHAVDRLPLAQALSSAAAGEGRVLEVLLQVNLDPDPQQAQGRGGCTPDDVVDLARTVTSLPNLTLRGLMGVAPLDGDADDAFARLERVSRSVREQVEPEADIVSAGMSDDLEAAIAHGATHVRIGSSLLGKRPPLH